MQTGKVDIPNTCIICGANITTRRDFGTCGEKCRKEFRRWSKLHMVAQRDLMEAAMAYGELIIACGEAGGTVPVEIHAKAIKMVQMAAVAYTAAAAKTGRLPTPDKET